MADTVITIEMARAIKTALAAVVPADTTIYAVGVADTLPEGESVPDGAEEPVKYPCVSIMVNECVPMQYRSALRRYPVTIGAATWYANDRDQTKLYTLAHAVSVWLALPSLSLTLAHWDALVIDGEPETDVESRTQVVAWRGTVNVRKA